MTRRISWTPVIALSAIVMGCASGNTQASASGRSSVDARPAAGPATPGGHEMAGMPGMSDHDMAGMAGASHAATESAFLFPDGDDKGWSKVENGVQHVMAPEVRLANLPPATRVELLRQLALTMDVIKKYPTAKDAEAAGYHRAGPFLPGLGTHYVGGKMSRTGTLTDDDIVHPSTIIYDGTKADSPIAGFMYIAMALGPSGKEPEGFAGPNDHWHFHTGICLVSGPNGAMEALGFDGSITETSCKTQRGNWVAATQYLLHVWTVPGYSDPLGVFAHTNPALTCGDGTYYTDNHDITNVCRKP